MQGRSQKYAAFVRARPHAPCAQCGKMLFGPEWSEYINEHQARHLWACSSCGYDFETLVVFPTTPEEQSEQAA